MVKLSEEAAPPVSCVQHWPWQSSLQMPLMFPCPGAAVPTTAVLARVKWETASVRAACGVSIWSSSQVLLAPWAGPCDPGAHGCLQSPPRSALIPARLVVASHAIKVPVPTEKCCECETPSLPPALSQLHCLQGLPNPRVWVAVQSHPRAGTAGPLKPLVYMLVSAWAPGGRPTLSMRGVKQQEGCW